jgi:hypothetical protein
MILKETISYYVAHNSQVNCVFLDATKAFDRVAYHKLFEILLERNVPPQFLRLMLSMYMGQQVKVLWNGIYSHAFPVLNGVKQGAILSPLLFCVYIDSLLIRLRSCGCGCYISPWFVGALAYADDIVLLAPSATAMRKMLNICDKYADSYNVSFNANKSKSIIFMGSRVTAEGSIPYHFLWLVVTRLIMLTNFLTSDTS